MATATTTVTYLEAHDRHHTPTHTHSHNARPLPSVFQSRLPNPHSSESYLSSASSTWATVETEGGVMHEYNINSSRRPYRDHLPSSGSSHYHEHDHEQEHDHNPEYNDAGVLALTTPLTTIVSSPLPLPNDPAISVPSNIPDDVRRRALDMPRSNSKIYTPRVLTKRRPIDAVHIHQAHQEGPPSSFKILASFRTPRFLLSHKRKYSLESQPEIDEDAEIQNDGQRDVVYISPVGSDSDGEGYFGRYSAPAQMQLPNKMANAIGVGAPEMLKSLPPTPGSLYPPTPPPKSTAPDTKAVSRVYAQTALGHDVHDHTDSLPTRERARTHDGHASAHVPFLGTQSETGHGYSVNTAALRRAWSMRNRAEAFPLPVPRPNGLGMPPHPNGLENGEGMLRTKRDRTTSNRLKKRRPTASTPPAFTIVEVPPLPTHIVSASTPMLQVHISPNPSTSDILANGQKSPRSPRKISKRGSITDKERERRKSSYVPGYEVDVESPEMEELEMRWGAGARVGAGVGAVTQGHALVDGNASEGPKKEEEEEIEPPERRSSLANLAPLQSSDLPPLPPHAPHSLPHPSPHAYAHAQQPRASLSTLAYTPFLAPAPPMPAALERPSFLRSPSNRRWTLGGAEVDALSDEVVVRELERLRRAVDGRRVEMRAERVGVNGQVEVRKKLIKEGVAATSGRQGVDGADGDADDGVNALDGHAENPAEPGEVVHHTRDRGGGSGSNAEVGANTFDHDAREDQEWKIATRALLVCRELVRTEGNYEKRLVQLSVGKTTTPPPPLLRPYLPPLLTASRALALHFADDPSAWGVASAFIRCASELERALVGWCGVIGEVFARPESDKAVRVKSPSPFMMKGFMPWRNLKGKGKLGGEKPSNLPERQGSTATAPATVPADAERERKGRRWVDKENSKAGPVEETLVGTERGKSQDLPPHPPIPEPFKHAQAHAETESKAATLGRTRGATMSELGHGSNGSGRAGGKGATASEDGHVWAPASKVNAIAARAPVLSATPTPTISGARKLKPTATTNAKAKSDVNRSTTLPATSTSSPSAWRKSVTSLALLKSPTASSSSSSSNATNFPVGKSAQTQPQRVPSGSELGTVVAEQRKEKVATMRELAIEPTQRVTRYVLLYKDLLDHTPFSSPSHQLVERALEIARHIATQCDRAQGNSAFLRRT